MRNTRIMCAVMLDTKVSLICYGACWHKLPYQPWSMTGRCIALVHDSMCHLWQGPEIRTGFLKNPDQPVKLTAGKEITLTTDYEFKGDEETIAMR